ncbi:capping complex subunit for YIEGIA [Caloranaerobacter sp. DY30410]|uniref:capping complex subunit for YIEGIA n=1 Tax=Caloranaerobacter sp. DY30410 TaxID=3238305 RepID=UPI003D057B10
MKESQTRSILAVVTLDKNLVIHSSAPTFLAKDKKSQEKIASELGRVLAGNVYGLANGVIIITQE